MTKQNKQNKKVNHAYGLTSLSDKFLNRFAPIKKTYEDKAIDRLLVSFGY